MAELTPARKRIAVLIVVVGSALIGERVVALMAGDDEVAAPLTHLRTRSRTEPATPDGDASAAAVRLDRLAARQQALEATADDAAATGVFEGVSWQPPAPKDVVAPAPAPVAPPFPYAYLGGLTDDGVRTAFFTQGDRVLPVKAGDTVDAAYRVDQMNDKQMTLTYLPLNQNMTVTFRSGR